MKESIWELLGLWTLSFQGSRRYYMNGLNEPCSNYLLAQKIMEYLMHASLECMKKNNK